MSADAPPQWLSEVPPQPGVCKPVPILVVSQLRKSFGGLQAVDIDHLEVQRGAITALIGPNGAGKTTLFNVLTGFDRADAGVWNLDDRPVTSLRAHQVARSGMVRTFQLTKALSRMTVLDNMLLAAPGQSGEHFFQALLPGWRRQESANRQRAEILLERFQLDTMRDEFAGSLSGGQRKLLEMARALMAEPSLLMLDEPMAGINPALTDSLLAHIAELRDEGLTVLFVEHDMDVVMDISDWVVVMASGAIIAEGPPAVVGSNPDVVDAYLGRHHGEASHI